MYKKIIITIILIMLGQYAQANEDSLSLAKSIKNVTQVDYKQKEIKLTIQNVDITKYPEVKIIVEAYDSLGRPLDSLVKSKIKILENDVEKDIISIEKISFKERIPIDIVFVLDQTATMQQHLDAVKNQISRVCNTLTLKGIDFRIGLILFSDIIEKIYQPSAKITNFLEWLEPVKAYGGGDVKENALEAIGASCNIQWRPSSNKIAILVTDAPFHQKGENGSGKTTHTTETISKKLQDCDIRLFVIAPTFIGGYKTIAESTRGKVYDLESPFANSLSSFSNQLTNLFAIKYKTTKEAIPDSIDISLVNEKRQVLTKRSIPVVELGRKLIIENLLYATGKAELPEKVSELEVLTEFMTNKPKVKILVEGHTDNIGSIFTNDKLSLQRAESVRKYLISKKIAPNRIKVKGYGSKSPISSNTTEFGRKLNRRTEIVIIEK